MSKTYYFWLLLSSILQQRISTLKCRFRSDIGGANHASNERVVAQVDEVTMREW